MSNRFPHSMAACTAACIPGTMFGLLLRGRSTGTPAPSSYPVVVDNSLTTSPYVSFEIAGCRWTAL